MVNPHSGDLVVTAKPLQIIQRIDHLCGRLKLHWARSDPPLNLTSPISVGTATILRTHPYQTPPCRTAKKKVFNEAVIQQKKLVTNAHRTPWFFNRRYAVGGIFMMPNNVLLRKKKSDENSAITARRSETRFHIMSLIHVAVQLAI